MKLADLYIKLGLKKDEFDKGIDGAKQKTSSFGSAMAKIGGIIAGAFSVQLLVNFGKELINLSGQVEGVKTAFERIGSAQDLQRLRESTKGTVNDFELMKRAVSAANFGIPIKQLGNLFEFASKRAQDTGQSVDYLVDSIVMGIGRKSPLILDNLGISAVQLKAKLGSVAMETATVGDVAEAVGKIAAESLQKTGGLLDTNATKIASITARWENFKISLSQTPKFIESVGTALTEVEMLVSGYTSAWDLVKGVANQKYWDKLLAGFDHWKKAQADAKNMVDTFGESYDRLNRLGGNTVKVQNEVIESTEEQKTAYEKLTAQISELEKKQADLATRNKDISGITAQIEALKLQKKAVDDLIASQTFTAKYGGEKPADFIAPIGLSGKVDTKTLGGMETINADRIKSATEAEAAAQKANVAQWDNFVNDLNAVAVDGVMGFADSLEQAFSDMASGNFDLSNFFGSIISQIGKFLAMIGKMFISYGIAQSAFFKSLAAGPAGAATLIAAGVALVAIGGAIGGIGSSMSRGNMSGSSSGVSGMYVTSSPYRKENEGKHFYDFQAVLKGDDIFLSTKRNGLKRSYIG